MQVTELSADGLKREYKIVVHANEIESRVSGRLNELRGVLEKALGEAAAALPGR